VGEHARRARPLERNRERDNRLTHRPLQRRGLFAPSPRAGERLVPSSLRGRSTGAI
jgi:hypothetical protein